MENNRTMYQRGYEEGGQEMMKMVVGEILELPRFIEEDDRGVKFPMVEIESIKNYAEQKGINLSLQSKLLTNKDI